MREMEKGNKSMDKNSIKRLFWVVVSKLERNSAKKNRIDAICDERINHFIGKWEKKREERTPPELLEEIEKDRAKVIRLGILNFQQLLSLLEGKTLNLNHGDIVKYYDDPQKWIIHNEDLLKKSLVKLGYKNLIISGEIIPKENMEEAITILKSQGYSLSKPTAKINEKALMEKIKRGEIKAEELTGIKREINQFFAVLTPHVEIREKINTVTEEY